MVTTASAAGKAILLGEHGVVYGRPAIAVPVSDVRATAEVASLEPGAGVVIAALDLDETYRLDWVYESDSARALQTTVRNTLRHLDVRAEEQALRMVVHSQIPIARGLGSGTAVATALVRALAKHYGHYLAPSAVSDLVYRTEIILHGTPSGIDNTVVAFEEPVYFVRERRADIISVGKPFSLVIGDTGVPSRTRDTVGDVRRMHQADGPRCEALFDSIAALVRSAREALASGEIVRLGQLMNENQLLLGELGVSSPELDRLIEAARASGSVGAKLSGGGRGGCMIALVGEGAPDGVVSALAAAGAARVMVTEVR